MTTWKAAIVGVGHTAALLVITVAAFAADRELSDALRTIAQDISKSLPVRVDNDKVLESAVAIHDTLIFKYKFTDETAINDPQFQTKRYLAALQNSLGQSMCGDRNTLALLRRGARYNYLMVTRDGRKVIDYTLDHKVCSAYLER